jgi:pentapeptide MXKDX repeat protein
MRTFFSLVAAGVVGLGVSLAVVGCGSPANPAKDKMSGDKMGAGKMSGDEMSGDKMGGKKDKSDDTKK